MANFNRDNRDSNKRDFRRRGPGGRGMDRQMHKTTCSECGNECEVPFKPTGDKPVFCNNCFGKRGSTEPRRGNDRNSRRGSDFAKRMYRVVCDSCGNQCEVPFQPTSGKPVYCQQCFKKSGDLGSKNTEQFKEQFDQLNAKLDQVLKALTPVPPIEVEAAPVQSKTSKPKPKKAAKKRVSKK